MEKTTSGDSYADLLKECSAKRQTTRWNNWRRGAGALTLRGFRGQGLDLRRLDLSDVDLTDADLRRADLSSANLSGSNFRSAQLNNAVLRSVTATDTDFRSAVATECDLRGGRFMRCDFRDSSFDRSDFSLSRLEQCSFQGLDTSLFAVDLSETRIVDSDLRDADLRGARIIGASLTRSDLRGAQLELAVLSGCRIKGVSLKGAFVRNIFVRHCHVDTTTNQGGLRPGFPRSRYLGKRGSSTIYEVKGETLVDDLEAAGHLATLGDSEGFVRFMLAGYTASVLVLGSFKGQKRMQFLKELRRYLFKHQGKNPFLFNIPPPANAELTDVVRTVAHMSEFVLADITEPASVPLELQAIAPNVMVPIVALIRKRARVFTMYSDLVRRYFWVLPPVEYSNVSDIIRNFDSVIAKPVRDVRRKIAKRREATYVTPMRVDAIRKIRRK